MDAVATGGRYTIGVQSNQAQCDGKSLDQGTVVVFALSTGRVTEALEMAEDTAQTSDFWS